MAGTLLLFSATEDISSSLFGKNTQFWVYIAHPRLRIKAETKIFWHPNPSVKKIDMSELIGCFTLKMVAK